MLTERGATAAAGATGIMRRLRKSVDLRQVGLAREGSAFFFKGVSAVPGSHDVSDKAPASSSRTKTTVFPKTAVGWWALGISVIGVASWVVLPVITTLFRDTYPVTDTWVMPAIGTVLIDAAAVTNVLVVWLRRERSVLNIVAAALTVPLALLFTLVVVGEGLSGA